MTEAVVGVAKASRGDYQASEDDNVTVQFVSRDKGALGYFGLAYYEENKDKLRAVPIVAAGRFERRAALDRRRSTTAPTPRCRARSSSTSRRSRCERPEVREFVEFYLKEGGALPREVGYVELPAAAYEMALKNFNDGKLGSGFGGKPEVGLKVEELLAREGKL